MAFAFSIKPCKYSSSFGILKEYIAERSSTYSLINQLNIRKKIFSVANYFGEDNMLFFKKKNYTLFS